MRAEQRRQRIGAALAALWLAAVLVADLPVQRPTLVLAPLYAIAPLIACAVLSAVPTAAFGGAAVVLAIWSNYWAGDWGTPQGWVRVADVTLVSTAAVVVSAVRVRRERQLARVERIAEVAQRTVLPLIPRQVGPVTVGSRYLSAAEDTLVGGDLYDWFHSDRRICFVVGDVRGKGVGAVEQAARVIRAFRQSAAAGADLATMAKQMNDYLTPFLDDEEFVTAALIQITDGTHVTLVNCGHPAPLFLPRGGGDPVFLEPPVGLPLGLGDSYKSLSMTWTTGDRILLYTDGLSEARDRGGEFLPLLPLGPLLSGPVVEDALDNVLAEVRQHVSAGRLTDDLAVLLLENAVPGGVAPDPLDSLSTNREPPARVSAPVEPPVAGGTWPPVAGAGPGVAVPAGAGDSLRWGRPFSAHHGPQIGDVAARGQALGLEAVDRPPGGALGLADVEGRVGLQLGERVLGVGGVVGCHQQAAAGDQALCQEVEGVLADEAALGVPGLRPGVGEEQVHGLQ